MNPPVLGGPNPGRPAPDRRGRERARGRPRRFSVTRQREHESEREERQAQETHPAGGPVPGDERDVEGDVVAEPDDVDEQFRQEDVEEADGERAPARETAFG